MSRTHQVEAFQSPKKDINAIILDYLTKEGYADAASKFCREAGMSPQQSIADLEMRRAIQQAIHSGDISNAIYLINDFDHNVLDNYPDIHFSLLRLHLIEMIRECLSKGNDPSVFLPVVAFAQQHLAPRASDNRDLLHSLEKAMALIVFPYKDLSPELRDLLNPKLRQEVADTVNRAILRERAQRSETAIHQLLRLHTWTEALASENVTPIPESSQTAVGH